jgi:tetratricopeptide (TPR) repeat protein
MTDQPREFAEGIRLARLAVELGKDDAVALTRAGHTLAHLAGDLDGAVALLDKALMLNPNLAAAWFLGGFLRAELGDPEAAIEFFTRAMRFSPLDPEMFRMQAGMAMSHLFAGRFDTALSWAEQSFRQLPTFVFVVLVIAACHALAGRKEQAPMWRIICASSIPRFVSPSSMPGSRYGGRRIAPVSRTACGWRACLSERHIGASSRQTLSSKSRMNCFLEARLTRCAGELEVANCGQ